MDFADFEVLTQLWYGLTHRTVSLDSATVVVEWFHLKSMHQLNQSCLGERFEPSQYRAVWVSGYKHTCSIEKLSDILLLVLRTLPMSCELTRLQSSLNVCLFVDVLLLSDRRWTTLLLFGRQPDRVTAPSVRPSVHTLRTESLIVPFKGDLIGKTLTGFVSSDQIVIRYSAETALRTWLTRHS